MPTKIPDRKHQTRLPNLHSHNFVWTEQSVRRQPALSKKAIENKLSPGLPHRELEKELKGGHICAEELMCVGRYKL